MLRRDALLNGSFTLVLLLLVAVTAPLRAQEDKSEGDPSEKAKPASDAAKENAAKPNKVRLARIVLEGNLAEAPTGGGLLGAIGADLRKVMGWIDKAAGDDKIQGLVLEIKSPTLGRGRAHELREAIAKFRKSGKK